MARVTMMGTALMFVAATALVAGCAPAPAAPAVDVKAEEQAIRQLDDQWNAAIARKDVEANVAFYAADGVVLWPDAPAGRGTAAIRNAWTEMLKAPNLKLVLTPEDIHVSQSGDLATDVGRVAAEMDTPQGHAKEDAKYLVVWKKVNGSWKVQYDAFNANAPMVMTK
jgi:uncharacterized protein (TIGR02246 family)